MNSKKFLIFSAKNIRCGIHILLFFVLLYGRLASSLCSSHSTKSDIHGSIMNPPDEWKTYFVWFIYLLFIYLFIWGFTSLSTLYRSYHDG